MNINDRDKINWNNNFALLKQKHLKPIIQIVLEPGTTPTEKDIDGIVEFLASLNWPTKTRYVSAFNEVNAAEYWGNKIEPERYAVVLNELITKFKAVPADFF